MKNNGPWCFLALLDVTLPPPDSNLYKPYERTLQTHTHLDTIRKKVPNGGNDINRGKVDVTVIVTTTNSIEGKKISGYLGLVTGETIMGANIVRDLFASITDIVGGRSGAYESKLREARELAIREMEGDAARRGANAIVGVDIDYEVVRDGMLMVTVSGTAVRVD